MNRVYFRVGNANYIFNIKSIFVINPLNSTDWTTDNSCFLKSISKVSLFGQTNYIYSAALDKYNFNLNGQYCDFPMYSEGDPSKIPSTKLIDENTQGGKYNLTIDNYYLVF